MEDDTVKVLWIATLICFLEGFAIYMGINGVALTLAIGALCGLGGYELKSMVEAMRGDKDER